MLSVADEGYFRNGVVRTKFDIYVFIKHMYHSNVCCIMMIKL